MNLLILNIVAIIALTSIIIFLFSLRKRKSDHKSKTTEDAVLGGIDNLFDGDIIDELEIKPEAKMERSEFIVKLNDRSWWKRSHKCFLSCCFILFCVIMISILSFITHSYYNTKQDIYNKKRKKELLHYNTIQKTKDSIRNEKIEIIFLKLHSIDVNIRKIKSATHRMENSNKIIIRNEL